MLLNAVKEQLIMHPSIHAFIHPWSRLNVCIYSYGVLWHRKRPLRASSYCVWLHTAARIVCSLWRFVTKGALHVRRFSMFCHPCWVYASSLRFATQGARASLDRDMFLYKPFLSKIVILNCSNPFVALICTEKILPLLTLLNSLAILMVPSAQALGMVNWVPLGLKVHSSDPGDAVWKSWMMLFDADVFHEMPVFS